MYIHVNINITINIKNKRKEFPTLNIEKKIFTIKKMTIVHY